MRNGSSHDRYGLQLLVPQVRFGLDFEHDRFWIMKKFKCDFVSASFDYSWLLVHLCRQNMTGLRLGNWVQRKIRRLGC